MPRYTRRPRKRSDSGVSRRRQPSRSQQKLSRRIGSGMIASGLPPAYLPKDDLGTVGVTGEIGASGAIGAADATDADFRAASARSHDEDPPNQPKEME